MDFSDALKHLKAGRKVARLGWNGKNMFIYLATQLIVTSMIVETGSDGDEKAEQRLEPCIVMYTAQGKYQPGWLASQPDMLAMDWTVIDG